MLQIAEISAHRQIHGHALSFLSASLYQYSGGVSFYIRRVSNAHSVEINVSAARMDLSRLYLVC